MRLQTLATAKDIPSIPRLMPRCGRHWTLDDTGALNTAPFELWISESEFRFQNLKFIGQLRHCNLEHLVRLLWCFLIISAPTCVWTAGRGLLAILTESSWQAQFSRFRFGLTKTAGQFTVHMAIYAENDPHQIRGTLWDNLLSKQSVYFFSNILNVCRGGAACLQTLIQLCQSRSIEDLQTWTCSLVRRIFW